MSRSPPPKKNGVLIDSETNRIFQGNAMDQRLISVLWDQNVRKILLSSNFRRSMMQNDDYKHFFFKYRLLGT